MFFVAAASAAAIDDGDKKQDKRGIGYGLGYGHYGGFAAPAIAAPIGPAIAAPIGAYHAPLGLHAPAIGWFRNIQWFFNFNSFPMCFSKWRSIETDIAGFEYKLFFNILTLPLFFIAAHAPAVVAHAPTVVAHSTIAHHPIGHYGGLGYGYGGLGGIGGIGGYGNIFHLKFSSFMQNKWK